MYILNNTHDKNYRSIYKDVDNVIFDISEKQLSNVKNAAWNDISVGSIVCVVKSSKKVSTFFRVNDKLTTENTDPEQGVSHVLTGQIVAKIAIEINMTTLLNRYDVVHPYLPSNKFGIGFHVADLGSSLDGLSVKGQGGSLSLEELVADNA